MAKPPIFAPLRDTQDLAKIDKTAETAHQPGADRSVEPAQGKDWEKAVRRVAEAAETGAQPLSLMGLRIDTLPPQIAALEGLRVLDLTRTRITDAGLAHLATLPALQSLDLTGTQITDPGLAHLATLPALQGLDLSDTQITDAGLASLHGFRALRDLGLNGTQISDTGLGELRNLNALKSLYLSRTRLRDISELPDLQKLTFLTLSNTFVTDLRPLLKLPLLSKGAWNARDRIHLRDTPAMDAPAIAAAMATENIDGQRKALLAHLRSLPEWPAPLEGGNPSKATPKAVESPKIFEPLSLSGARTLLEQNYPLVRDRCQAVTAELLDAKSNLAMHIPNDPEKLESHQQVGQSLTFALGLITSVHDALPEDFTDRPLTEEEVGAFRSAFNRALVRLEQAAKYIDRPDHGVTYGGILRLGVATAIGGVVALVPGVALTAAVPGAYAALYGKEGVKSLIGTARGKDEPDPSTDLKN